MGVTIIEKVYSFLWGDLFQIPLPGGSSLGISLLILLLIPAGIYFTIRTRFLPIRLFPDMVKSLMARKEQKDSLSTFQTLLVSTATRVGMGNLVGVVAAISIGGAGAVFWMWITAIIGSSTAFIEATLAQLHKEEDPLYGGYRGGPAYYIHDFIESKLGKEKKHVLMAVLYFVITVFIIVVNFRSIPAVFSRIFEEAFGIRQVAAGGFGAVMMNGIKRGLFSNEAGSGSAPCAAAAAECDLPVRAGLTQAFGVFVDTIIICSCTAMIMLMAPESVTAGKSGMDLLQSAMQYHLGSFGVIFIAVTLFLFSFSTFLGILFYARSNVSYLLGDKWIWQTLYKILALVMLFIGGIATYTFVWDLGDVGIGLMTIFNIAILYPMGGQALKALKEYEEKRKQSK